MQLSNCLVPANSGIRQLKLPDKILNLININFNTNQTFPTLIIIICKLVNGRTNQTQ